MGKVFICEKTKAEIEKDCITWAKEIENIFTPDVIVFIAKSGYLFAEPLSKYFKCSMVDISISRPGNNGKDRIKRLLPRIPRWMLFSVLRSKASYGYQEKNSKREVKLSKRFLNFDWNNYKKILIVDDSTDTGWSLLEAKRVVNQYSKDAEIKTLSYCVIDISEKRIGVDFYRYRNTIVVSATSRYSKENGVFLKSLECWKRENTNQNSIK